jgi:hypothetical protein
MIADCHTHAWEHCPDEPPVPDHQIYFRKGTWT